MAIPQFTPGQIQQLVQKGVINQTTAQRMLAQMPSVAPILPVPQGLLPSNRPAPGLPSQPLAPPPSAAPNAALSLNSMPPPAPPPPNLGAAFGAPRDKDDIQPVRKDALVDIPQGSLSPNAQKTVSDVAADQEQAGLPEHQKTFNKMADNPSLRSGQDSGPAQPETPPDGHSPANAGAANALQSAKAIEDWKRQAADVWSNAEDKPIGDQIDVVKRQGELDQRLAQELYGKSVMADAIASQAKQRDAEVQQKEAEDQISKVKLLDDYASKLNDTKIDSSRWFHNQSTFQKIGTTILAIFGGLAGDGKTVQGLIDRDVNAQIKELDNKRQGVDQRRSILLDEAKAMGNKDQARAFLRTALTDNVLAQVNQAKMKYGSEAAGLKADALISDLSKQRGDSYWRFWNLLNPDPRMAAKAGAGSKAANSGAKDLSEALEKAAVPDTESAVKQAQDIVDKGGDTMGTTARNWADPGSSLNTAYATLYPEAAQNEQTLQNAAAQYMLSKTGKAATDAEAKRLANILFGDRSQSAIKKGLSTITTDLRAKKDNIEAITGPEGRAEYYNRLNTVRSERRGAPIQNAGVRPGPAQPVVKKKE